MNEIRKAFDTTLYLEKKNVLVTAGPTREAIDPVRFISNRSSGKMGYAIAKSAKDFGANVDLVSGPVNLEDLSEINIIKVETADEMDKAVQHQLKKINYDYIFMTAAVSDYKVKKIKENKIKSENQSLELQLSKSTDILKKIAANQNSAKIIGFALETNNGEDEALKKLKNKKLDYIVLNYANEEGAGFETNTNHVFLYSKSGHKIEFKLDRKDRIAKNIIKQVL